MYLQRSIFSNLEKWKSKKNRKPLILRGARQVGKTSVLKEFSKSYRYKITLNLEKPKHKQLFEDNDYIDDILGILFTKHNIPVGDKSNTLLIIDEIQESPKAIHLLRYFYEEYPTLHIIAAGSLLEFAIRNTHNFPVGRVEFLYIYPFNFQEYLLAINQNELINELNTVPVNSNFHNKLVKLFNYFITVGGMPEVIKTLVNNNNEDEISYVYESLWSTFQNDMEKYTNSDLERRITKHIIESAPNYVNKQVNLDGFGNSSYSKTQIEDAFRNLNDARIVQLIYPTNSNEIPLCVDYTMNPKLQFIDTGLLNYCLQIKTLLKNQENLLNVLKGTIIAHAINQELISINAITRYHPTFSIDHKSNCLIDLLYTHEDKIIPIQIITLENECANTIENYIDQCSHHYAVQITNKELSIEQKTTKRGKKYQTLHLPYYLGTKIPNYVEWFIANY